MAGFEYDASAVAREEANYQTPTAKERRAFVRNELALDPGETVLSIGCGPGFEPAELASTGQPESVTGVELNSLMLTRARERCPTAVSLLHGDATTLPIADGAFDAAVSVQVYEYIDDLTDALAELHRVLDDDGRAVVYATDWDSLIWKASDSERADRVLDVWDGHCVHPRLGSDLRSVFQSAPFEVVDITGFPIVLTELGRNSFAQYLLEFIREFAATELTAETTQAWADDLRTRDRNGETFFSLCQYSYLVTPVESR
jgi:ubiquinone/menaquinone biosynthesis C-methylase UbiE